MKMKTIDPTVIGQYIKDASNIQMKLNDMRGYVDLQNAKVEELKKKYKVSDVNCSESEKAKNPYSSAKML